MKRFHFVFFSQMFYNMINLYNNIFNVSFLQELTIFMQYKECDGERLLFHFIQYTMKGNNKPIRICW